MSSGKARPPANAGAGRRAQGFAYIAVLIGVAVVAIGLGAVSEVWVLSGQRQREQELLFVGNQYRDAITRYYVRSPRGALQFPRRLEDLLEDPRAPEGVRRHLRKLYPDPLTGKADWDLVTLADGSIVGVASRSQQRPVKQQGFRQRDAAFEGQSRYADWVFRSPLPAANPVLGAGGGYSSGRSDANGAPAAPPVTQGPIRSTPGSKPASLPTLH